jgi:predicted  nucleic acid-binding Zn-ribbon protein
MSNQQVVVLEHELITANDHLVQLDSNIKQLEEQYANLVVVIDAFEKSKELLQKMADELPEQLELALDEEE